MEPKTTVSVMNIDMADVMQDLKLTVKGSKVMARRWAVAGFFFRLAASIAGCAIEIIGDFADDDSPLG